MGLVLDAESGAGLPGAVVVLAPSRPGVVAPAAAGGAFWSGGIATTTDPTGGYSFREVPAGDYYLLVRRLGYRPRVLELELHRPGPLRVSVGLVVQPIMLQPEEVVVPATLFTTALTYADELRGARLDAELFRQRTFFESDVRVLTHTDVVEAVTLGETDVFRALHRLPGVSTRDDFTAELWTRGAPASLTRVYFDEMPLYNPLHTAGVFSAINPDAVGAAFFHPGVRAASMGEGAAGLIDLTSRIGGGERATGAAELSVVSGRLGLTGGLAGRGGWMIAGRRSYVDLLTKVFADSADRIPYSFYDLTTRVDIPVGQSGTLELSGLFERDQVDGDVRDLLRFNTGFWGNTVGRATLALPVGELYTRHTVGMSRFDGDVRIIGLSTPDQLSSETDSLAPFRDVQIAVTHEPTSNRLTYLTVRSSVEPTWASDQSRWAVGYDFSLRRQRYTGPAPRPYPLVVFQADSLDHEERHGIVAVWGEHRWSGGPVQMEAGLRAELSEGFRNGPPVALAPRVTLRYAPAPGVGLAAAYGRSYQYAQVLAPAGPQIGPDLHITDVWLLANDSIPAIRSDVATLGAEFWLGEGWLGTANLYGRYATGLAVPDPRPGSVLVPRALYEEGINRAAGLELSLRRLAGTWTASIGYTVGVSRLRVDTLEFPSPADRRHVLDATVMTRLGRSLRVGGAFGVASGAPFTRLLLQEIPCDTLLGFCPDSVVRTTTVIEAPYANRTPAYVTFDLFTDWTKDFGSWSLGVYLQLRNALNRRGAVTYTGSFINCTPSSSDQVEPRPGVCDSFDRGLPLLPLLGVSARF